MVDVGLARVLYHQRCEVGAIKLQRDTLTAIGTMGTLAAIHSRSCASTCRSAVGQLDYQAALLCDWNELTG